MVSGVVDGLWRLVVVRGVVSRVVKVMVKGVVGS